MMFNLITWHSFLDFKVTPSFYLSCNLWKKVTVCSPHVRDGNYASLHTFGIIFSFSFLCIFYFLCDSFFGTWIIYKYVVWFLNVRFSCCLSVVELYFDFWFHYSRKDTVYDFNSFKFFEICFMSQDIIYLGDCPWALRKNIYIYILMVDDLFNSSVPFLIFCLVVY